MTDHTQNVAIYVFTGTGNSLLLAEALAEKMREASWNTELFLMEGGLRAADNASMLGIVFPIAWMSTYPTVLDFIKKLPQGGGRPVFLAGSMGAFALGAEGPIKKALLKKGYQPLAARFFIMPSNYNNKVMPTEENKQRIQQMQQEVAPFVQSLVTKKGRWGSGVPLLSQLFFNLAGKRLLWDLFYTLFPLTVDNEKCTGCGRCTRLCPTGAIRQEGEYLQIHKEACQSCQRCIAFCPVAAISVPEKPAETYRAVSFEALQKYAQKESYSERRERLKKERADADKSNE